MRRVGPALRPRRDAARQHARGRGPPPAGRGGGGVRDHRRRGDDADGGIGEQCRNAHHEDGTVR